MFGSCLQIYDFSVTLETYHVRLDLEEIEILDDVSTKKTHIEVANQEQNQQNQVVETQNAQGKQDQQQGQENQQLMEEEQVQQELVQALEQVNNDMQQHIVGIIVFIKCLNFKMS